MCCFFINSKTSIFMIPLILQFLRSKLFRAIALIVFIAILILCIMFQCKRLEQLKSDNERISSNFNNVTIQKNMLDSTIKNNTKIYHSQSLELTAKELKTANENLAKQLTDIGLKLKNLKSVTTINYNYNYSIDSGVKISKKNDSIFYCEFDDSVFNMRQKISLIDNKSNVKIDSLHVTIHDKILIPYEIRYKRYWLFWKRPVCVTVHVVSENKNLFIDRVENIDLIKK